MNDTVVNTPSPEGITSPSLENPRIISPLVDNINPASSDEPPERLVIVITENVI